jgi:hypothetical protein
MIYSPAKPSSSSSVMKKLSGVRVYIPDSKPRCQYAQSIITSLYYCLEIELEKNPTMKNPQHNVELYSLAQVSLKTTTAPPNQHPKLAS